LPADCQWGDAPAPAAPRPRPAPRPVAPDALESSAAALRADDARVLLLGGAALGERGLRAAARIAAATGCRVMHETFFARLERGGGLPAFERMPYFPERASEALCGVATLVLAGAREPVAFFGYPDLPSRLEPEGCRTLRLADAGDDVAGALESLADALGAPAAPAPRPPAARPSPPQGALDAGTLGQVLAALQPEDAIVVDEAATSGGACFGLAAGAPRHSWLSLTGGSIGQGLPCAVGAALACPDRKVIALQADGGGMYTLQALWTLAREGLDVVVVVCANRSYRILQLELHRAGIAEPGPLAMGLTDLSRPALDWTALARGHGVPASRAETAEALAEQLRRALAEPGPALIEAVLAS
ncbi:MAG: acetolactate synthase large subunit, partial [Myxococcota bacterium]|nr:acetolactate synthase large subunit [Myxococcota bacterium]